MTSATAHEMRRQSSASNHLALLLVIGAGVASAFQVGKATLALEAIRTDLNVDLAAASWMLSAFALVGAVASLLIGAAADRFQARVTVIAGLWLQAAGSALGAMANALPALLAARALEGLGFLAVTVAAPVMVVAATAPAARKRAFAAWATFMPVGMAIIMLAAPLLNQLGWRGVWWVNALLLATYAIALAAGTTSLRTVASTTLSTGWLGSLRNTLGSVDAWFLAGQFCAYTTVFFALFGFLPSILGDRLAVDQTTAGVLSAIAIAAGAAGCLACGALLQRGYRASRLLMIGFAILALCSVGILAARLPGELAYALCILFSFAGAFIPVVVFDAAPRLTTRPEMLGSVVGLATQGNNAGIVIGPAMAGALATAVGWQWVTMPVVLIAVVAMIAAHRFQRRLDGVR